ncbi:MAG: hypothetical protein ACRCWM_07530 [Sarcina sp.]
MSSYKRIYTEDVNGNIEYAGLMKDSEDIKIIKKLSDEQNNAIKRKDDLGNYSSELGGFIQMMYISNEILFNGIGIDRSNISRLIYLATYIDYNDREENVLVKHGQNNKIEYLTKNDMKEIMGLSKTTFNDFMRDLKDNELLFEANGKFYMTTKYFSKGKSNFDKKKYTRVFINTTRELYKGCSSRMHKKLSYVFQLIPFLNYETNILCSNPNEVNKDELNKLGLQDICELLGLSTQKNAMNKFEHDLYKILINIDGKNYYMFTRVITKGEYHNDYFLINPNIIWNGSNVDNTKETIKWLYFSKKKKK